MLRTVSRSSMFSVPTRLQRRRQLTCWRVFHGCADRLKKVMIQSFIFIFIFRKGKLIPILPNLQRFRPVLCQQSRQSLAHQAMSQSTPTTTARSTQPPCTSRPIYLLTYNYAIGQVKCRVLWSGRSGFWITPIPRLQNFPSRCMDRMSSYYSGASVLGSGLQAPRTWDSGFRNRFNTCLPRANIT